MAKVRICDHCGAVVDHPHKAYFREYYIGCEFDICGVFPVPTSRSEKIDLCKDCYSKLKSMKEKKDGQD